MFQFQLTFLGSCNSTYCKVNLSNEYHLKCCITASRMTEKSKLVPPRCTCCPVYHVGFELYREKKDLRIHAIYIHKAPTNLTDLFYSHHFENKLRWIRDRNNITDTAYYLKKQCLWRHQTNILTVFSSVEGPCRHKTGHRCSRKGLKQCDLNFS